MTNLSRRDFLLASGFSTAALSLASRRAIGQMVGTPAPFNDYRALVCVFLFGGNDSFNMLVPRSDAEYNAYAASRQNLAIAKDQLLPISPLVRDGADYGLHPSMTELAALFESGSAAFVTNVGPLLEPVTKEAYRAYTVALPPQLYSHNDQQDQWHALRGHSRTKSGWAGRIADLLRANVTNQQLALNVSLSGNSLFQSGDQTVSYVMGPGGPLAFQRFGATGLARERRLAFERVLGASYDSIYARGFVDVQQRALESADRVTAALAAAPTLSTTFPATPLGQQLATVARIIAVRDRLEMHRQIFFVATGGFDSHDNQITDQPRLARQRERRPRGFLPRDQRARRRLERHGVHAVGFRPNTHLERRRHGSRLGRQPDRGGRCRARPHALRPLSELATQRPRRHRQRRPNDTDHVGRSVCCDAREVVRCTRRRPRPGRAALEQVRPARLGLSSCKRFNPPPASAARAAPRGARGRRAPRAPHSRS